MTGVPGESKGIALTNWLVNKAAGVLDRKSSRRGFLLGSAMVGSAVAVAGCAPATQPGSPYSHITDCAGGLCTDGYTEFCCTINNGVNACPPGTFVAGWWRADYSSFCNGTRYYMDCNQSCCGPNLGNGFCAGCSECRCAGGCDTRRVYCNYFRYGQCHQEIGILGPIACRLVTCVPPYTVAEYACTTALAVDNSTAEHAPAKGCTPPPPPFVRASVLPSTGAASALSDGTVCVAVRQPDTSVALRAFNGSSWGSTQSLGPSIRSGLSSAVAGSSLFVFGYGADHAVWVQQRDGTGPWSGWRSLHGNVVSDPVAVSDGSTVRVFVRGSDDALWVNTRTSSSWSGFVSLGGAITSEPTAVSDSTGTYVFARGADKGQYYQRFSGGWSGWRPLGGLATSDPAACSDPAGIFLFVRGSDNAMYVSRLSSGSWTSQRLGGFVNSDPAAVSDPSGVYVFIRGGDRSVYYQRFASNSWSGWQSLGGGAAAGPIAVSSSNGLFVFVQGLDNRLYVQRLSNGSWSGWQPLGITVDAVRGGR